MAREIEGAGEAGGRLRVFLAAGELFLPLLYLAIILFDVEFFKRLVVDSMPIRGLFKPMTNVPGASHAFNWSGILLVYVLPLAWGVYLSWRRREDILSSTNPSWTLVKLSYTYSLAFCLPLYLLLFQRTTWDDYAFFHALGYCFLLFPFLVVLGMCLYATGSRGAFVLRVRRSKAGFRTVILLALILLVFISIKVVLLEKSDYPIGNDAYYHTALSLRLAEGDSPASSPLMEGVPNSYPPLPHYMVVGLSRITGASVLRVWPYFDLAVQLILLLAVFYFAYSLSGNANAALLAMLLIFPWDQFWLEHSSRRLSLALMLIFWVLLVKFAGEGKKRYLACGFLALLLIVGSHHLTAAIALLTGAIYLLAVRYGEKVTNRLGAFATKARSGKGERKTRGWKPAPRRGAIGSDAFFAAALCVLALTASFFLFAGFKHFSPRRMTFFGEIGISLNRPIGIITLVLVPAGLTALLGALREDRPRRIMLLSVAALYLSSFFYVTRFGQLFPPLGFQHIRLVSEAGCISLAVSASLLLVSSLEDAGKARRRAGVIALVVALSLSAASIYGKIRIEAWYAGEINKRMSIYGPTLEEIAQLEPDSIILTDPDDFINRYIPGVTGRRIYVARYFTDEKGRNAIILPTLEFFNKKQLKERYDLNVAYFQDMTGLDLLGEVKQLSPITHILVSSKSRFNEFLRGEEGFVEVYSNEGYVLYGLPGL